ncbi:phage tail protein [Glaciimonas sp. GNP009]
MSAGQVVGGIAGAVIGFFAGGGPQGAIVGAQLGMGVGGMVDPPKGPHIYGPKLTDMSTQTSTYGAVIPRVYGTVPIIGNVFWLENNRLKETENTQKQGKGGGGAESTTFTYSATFAVGLCEGPIAGVNRIWIGANLIYDAGATDIGAIIASGDAAPFFNIYTGTETQLPDPRMQSTLGVANTPAYRGLAYIVFYDLPLTKYQNSLMGAQVKVEVARVQVTSGPTLAETVIVPGTSLLYSTSALCMDRDGRMNVFLSQTAAGAGGIVELVGAFPTGQIARNGSFVGLGDYHLPGSSDIACVAATDGSALIVYVQDVNGALLSTIPLPTALTSLTGGYHRRLRKQFVIDWGVAGTSNYCNVYDVSNGLTLVNSTNSSSTYGKVHDIFIGTGEYYAITETLQFICFDTTWSVKWVVNLSVESNVLAGFGHSGGTPIILRSSADGVIYLKFSNYFYRVTQSGYVFLGQVTFPGPYSELGGNAVIGDLWATYNAQDNTVYYVSLGHTSAQNELLSTIILEEALKSNLLTSADVDVTALTQEVRGYTISSAAAIRSGFDPLIGAWPFDVVQSGYQVVCKPRGGASVVTIPVARLDARSVSGAPGVQITNSREMDSVLPSKVALKYFDSDREYNTGEQYAERLNTQSVNVAAMDLPIVLSADEAAQKAEILLYMYWLERYDVSFSLPPAYAYLEPSDIITIAAADASYELRLTQINYTSDGRLECLAKFHSAAVYTSTASGGVGASTGQALTLAGPSQYDLLDIPLVKDVFDTAGFPVAMSGYLPGWVGGILMRSDDSGQTWTQVQGFSKPGGTIGYASNSLSAHNGLLIDKWSTLRAVIRPSLFSVTELQMLNGANHFAYGVDGRWEIIAAQNCILQADGTYSLTDLLRGRFGSEWATGLHAINDRLVLLDSANLQFVTSSLNTIGMARTYRAITNGKTIDSDGNRTMTYKGVNLKCLSPVYLNGSRDPASRDWTLTWIRRTRKGGELRDFIDAPLSEASESYAIDIFADSSYGTVIRKLTALLPTVIYDNASQVTDFGIIQATLYIKIYQLSATTGRGSPLTATITR